MFNKLNSIPYNFPTNPTGWDFFWMQLPYALPGFLTLFIGLLLIILLIYNWKSSQSRITTLCYIGLILSLSTLSILISLRASIDDLNLLLQWHYHLYWIAAWLPMFFLLLSHIMLNFRYKIFIYMMVLTLGTILYSYFSLYKGTAFTGEWIHYSFGNYPVGGLALKIWGIFNTLSYLLILIPFAHYYLSKNRPKIIWQSHFAFHLFSILIISNLPSLVGIPIYPGAGFFFIPMVFLVYGMFRSSFSNLNDFLFARKGIFLITTATLTILLILTSLLISLVLRPVIGSEIYNPHLLMPLFSAILALSLSAYIAGINPSEKINIYASITLLFSSCLQIVIVTKNIELPDIVSYRIEQLFYIPFAFIISITYRFLTFTLDIKKNWMVHFIDAGCLFISISAISPFLFNGYYQHSFGRVSESGIIAQFFGIFGLFINGYLVYLIYKRFKNKSAPFPIYKKYIVIFFFLNGFLMILNVPATMGIPFYLTSNFAFVPFLLIGYAIFKHEALVEKGKAASISNRVSVLSFLVIPLTLFMYYFALPEGVSSSQKFIHILLVGSPMMIGLYAFSFILTRPIAKEIDTIILDIQNEKYIAEEANREIRDINLFTKMINSSLDLESVIEYTFHFLKKKYEISAVWFLELNEDSKILKSRIYRSDVEFMESQSTFLNSFRINMLEHQSIMVDTIRKNRPILIRRLLVKNINFKDFDIYHKGGIRNCLLIPLDLENKSVGILGLSNLHSPTLNLSKKQINSITRITDQLTGVFLRSSLLDQLKHEKIAVESSRKVISNLNDVTLLLSKSSNFSQMMEVVKKYLHDEFQTSGVWVLRPTGDSKNLATDSFNTYKNFNHEQQNFINTFNRELTPELGMIYLVYNKKKNFYIPDTSKLKKIFPSDKELIDTLHLKSILLQPLVVNNECIGIVALDLSSRKESLKKPQLNRIEFFSQQIAGALERSLLFEQTLQAKTKSIDLANELQQLNILNQNLNESININDFFEKVISFLKSEFQFEYHFLFKVSNDDNYAEIFQTDTSYNSKTKEAFNYLKKNPIPLNGNNGALFWTRKLAKSMYNFNAPHRLQPTEHKFLQMLGIKNNIASPLIIQSKTIGFIVFGNIKMDKLDFKNNNRNKFDTFSNQIASSLYKSLLFDNLNQTYSELKNSQDQLIQSEKMAALGQLVAGVAHEINTPLGAIKASIQNITTSLDETLEYFPKVIKGLSDENLDLFYKLLARAKSEKKVLSTREERKIKNNLTEELEDLNLTDPEGIADYLVDMGVYSSAEEFIDLFKMTNVNPLQLAYNLVGFQSKTNTIQSAVDKAGKIVFALKNYSHFDQSESKTLANIVEGIETVLTIYQNSIKQGIELITDFETMPDILCYPDELNQIWTNLLQNSIQAMQNKGILKIRTSSNKVKDEICVEFEDNGPGVPKEIQEKIFQAFYTTKQRGEGSGLGLHITKQIIEKHSGRLEFESNPGKTVFRIYLPIHDKAQEKL
jgi:signal transduction histidine kinase/GAF domain-containing protein